MVDSVITQKEHKTNVPLTGRGSGLIPYKPGQSGNPKGRPKGSRSKLSEDFVDTLYSDFQLHGKQAIERVREEKPEVYIQTIAKLLPRDIKVEVKELTKIAHVIVNPNDNKEIDASQLIEIAPTSNQALDSAGVTSICKVGEELTPAPPMNRIVG